ncbi:MAG: sigma-70 family RNA polymerase sigma factor [Oscillospiraceae bacterium]
MAKTSDIIEIYEKYYSKVYNYFFYSQLKEDVARDLTSQTFLKVLTKWDSYDAEKAKESTWLFAIAKNTLIDYYRKKELHLVSIDDWQETGQGTNFIAKDISKSDLEFFDMIKTLREREREIIVSRFYFEMSYGDIAEIMGLTATNVSVIISRCIKKLRKIVVL